MPPSDADASDTPRRAAWLARLGPILAPLSFLLILAVTLSFTSPRFATRNNLLEIAIQSAVVAILACGQTAVIISGNIDLSVGAVMALAGVAAAKVMVAGHMSIPVGVAAALLAGLAAGGLSGVITAVGRIPSFIVTLGMMGVVYGASGLASNSQNIGGLPEKFSLFSSGQLFGSASTDGIPYAVVILALVAVAVHFALSRSAWGRGIYAMGGNRQAARLSGLRLPWLTVSVFALSGLLAGVAAILNVARAGVAQQDAGGGYELYAVSATVIGGTSLFGGQGAIPGTIIGALLMFTIQNGCALANVGPDAQRIVIGSVVIGALLYDRHGPGRKRAAQAE